MTDQELRELLEPALAWLSEYETKVVRDDRSRPALVVLFVLEQLRGATSDVDSVHGDAFTQPRSRTRRTPWS